MTISSEQLYTFHFGCMFYRRAQASQAAQALVAIRFGNDLFNLHVEYGLVFCCLDFLLLLGSDRRSQTRQLEVLKFSLWCTFCIMFMFSQVDFADIKISRLNKRSVIEASTLFNYRLSFLLTSALIPSTFTMTTTFRDH